MEWIQQVKKNIIPLSEEKYSMMLYPIMRKICLLG